MPIPAGADVPGQFDAGPCEPWTPLYCDAWPADLLPIQDMAVMAATEILWEKTKKRFGLCEYTLRPCAEECAGTDALAWLYGSWLPTWGMSGGGFGWPYPALIGGTWWNLGCGSCSGACSCTEVHQIELPFPVAEVLDVKVDGVELDPSAYIVNDWKYLVRVDGERWPRCNDLNLPDTEEGTWSVTATYGEQVPIAGRFAVNELALEYARACVGQACNLSAGVVSKITRQGVTKDLLTAAKNGDLGLLLSDRFVNTYNPTRSGVATIIALDSPRATRWGT